MSQRPESDDGLLDEALAWHRALEEDDVDWGAYVRWLEADPRHRVAYDEVALVTRIVEDNQVRLRNVVVGSAPEPMPQLRRLPRWMLPAAAAALALGIGVPMAVRTVPDDEHVTGAGETRRVVLGGGIAVDLAPSSTLVAKGGESRTLELRRGQAYFDVVHDPNRPMSVRAGGYEVTDVGTRFGVNLAARTLLVDVADGRLSVKPPGRAADVRLSAGQTLIGPSGGGVVRVARVSPEAVGSWRRGQLIYSDVPLGVVAADISRYAGRTVDVDEAIADRRFSGVLAVGDGTKLVDALSGFMGLSQQARGDRIHLAAAAPG